MSNNKMQETDASVEAFLDAVPSEGKRADSYAILDMMRRLSGEEPKMWGSIVGFGRVHYKYDSGREGDMPLIGFSPRKQNLSLYIMTGFDHHDDLLPRLGKHKLGKSCLYINKLADVDEAVLRQMIDRTVAYMRSKDVHGRLGAE